MLCREIAKEGRLRLHDCCTIDDDNKRRRKSIEDERKGNRMERKGLLFFSLSFFLYYTHPRLTPRFAHRDRRKRNG